MYEPPALNGVGASATWVPIGQFTWNDNCTVFAPTIGFYGEETSNPNYYPAIINFINTPDGPDFQPTTTFPMWTQIVTGSEIGANRSF
jgi:hypothetical protein